MLSGPIVVTFVSGPIFTTLSLSLVLGENQRQERAQASTRCRLDRRGTSSDWRGSEAHRADPIFWELHKRLHTRCTLELLQADPTEKV